MSWNQKNRAQTDSLLAVDGTWEGEARELSGSLLEGALRLGTVGLSGDVTSGFLVDTRGCSFLAVEQDMACAWQVPRSYGYRALGCWWPEQPSWFYCWWLSFSL